MQFNKENRTNRSSKLLNKNLMSSSNFQNLYRFQVLKTQFIRKGDVTIETFEIIINFKCQKCNLPKKKKKKI